ncbi:type I-E CRISPR-associated protein Cse2/CasB [Nocardiopsis sp. FR6]|uniref:type I-E CRISPR-associated protein Cse2/CasB n=1 Tax=Nocardiopsis sp. FR6 TaxID=2605986 RepID=UPI00135AB188|nr:type I-E CRISPR-associated protein Cse2/CasB [Nocardiopsis sp. FR6]
MSPTEQQRRPHRWEQLSPTDSQAGRILADLRRGLGREAGDVPEMWVYYTTLNKEGYRTAALKAEHAALSLFGLHQQSQRIPMHKSGVGLGEAALNLYLAANANQAAIDGRMNMIATSTDTTELVGHLRGLVTLLRERAQPLDYTRLFLDLRYWDNPQDRATIRRHWGGQYMDWHKRNPRAEASAHNNA